MMTIALSIGVVTLLIVTLSIVVHIIRSVLLPTHTVKLVVNSSLTVPINTGKTLLNALAESDVHVPTGCAGAGTCGLCKVTVNSGGGAPLSTENAILTDKEISEGFRLACQVSVQDNIDVTIPNELLTIESWPCTVASSRNLSALIKEIVLKLPEGKNFEFTAGQYVQVSVPSLQCHFKDFTIDTDFREDWDKLNVAHLEVSSAEPIDRAYSMANNNADSSKIQTEIVLLVRLALPPEESSFPPGLMSSHLYNLDVGDPVSVRGPYGDFAIRTNDRMKVFIGGGVGMAPLRAMIHTQINQANTEEIRFFYGARSVHDLLYQEEFDALQESHSNFEWNVALSDPNPNDQWHGDIGFIHVTVYRELIENNKLATDHDYYLCGPPAMVQAVVKMLTDAGVSNDHIYADSFG